MPRMSDDNAGKELSSRHNSQTISTFKRRCFFFLTFYSQIINYKTFKDNHLKLNTIIIEYLHEHSLTIFYTLVSYYLLHHLDICSTIYYNTFTYCCRGHSHWLFLARVCSLGLFLQGCFIPPGFFVLGFLPQDFCAGVSSMGFCAGFSFPGFNFTHYHKFTEILLKHSHLQQKDKYKNTRQEITSINTSHIHKDTTI